MYRALDPLVCAKPIRDEGYDRVWHHFRFHHNHGCTGGA